VTVGKINIHPVVLKNGMTNGSMDTSNGKGLERIITPIVAPIGTRILDGDIPTSVNQ
jgi:hypothetical protein